MTPGSLVSPVRLMRKSTGAPRSMRLPRPPAREGESTRPPRFIERVAWKTSRPESRGRSGVSRLRRWEARLRKGLARIGFVFRPLAKDTAGSQLELGGERGEGAGLVQVVELESGDQAGTVRQLPGAGGRAALRCDQHPAGQQRIAGREQGVVPGGERPLPWRKMRSPKWSWGLT